MATEQLLIAAREKGSQDGINKALADGADPNAIDAKGMTALMYACSMHGLDRSIRILLNAKATIDLICKPTRVASSKAIIQEGLVPLQDREVYPPEMSHPTRIQAEEGMTALMFAARGGSEASVQLLLDAKASLHLMRTADRKTALDLAVSEPAERLDGTNKKGRDRVAILLQEEPEKRMRALENDKDAGCVCLVQWPAPWRRGIVESDSQCTCTCVVHAQ